MRFERLQVKLSLGPEEFQEFLWAGGQGRQARDSYFRNKDMEMDTLIWSWCSAVRALKAILKRVVKFELQAWLCVRRRRWNSLPSCKMRKQKTKTRRKQKKDKDPEGADEKKIHARRTKSKRQIDKTGQGR
jgi:hypothetical protein